MGLELKYFVLNPRGKHRNDRWARAAQAAMRIFAEWIKNKDPKLCQQLNDWADQEEIRQGELPETTEKVK